MRVIALLLIATLVGSAAAAQTTAAPTAPSPASNPDAKAAADLDPVSLQRIREAIERASARDLLSKKVQDTPTYRVEIRERIQFEDVLATLDVPSGPTPRFGLYNYEYQRLTTPSVDNPLAQPWAAFNEKELLILAGQTIANSVIGSYMSKSLTAANRKRRSQAARAEVDRAIAEYCASRENGGAGIQLCTPPR